MPRTIRVAAVQMDARPAPTGERLDRAGRLVSQAAAAGANLVVLPELFNVGYTYSDDNHYRAEPADGPTVTWLRQTAALEGIHLAGSLLLVDGTEVYNTLLLAAPDGRTWRYDKNYPWGWERAYFRNGQGPTVARTDLGDFGLMLCWDTAHLELWRQYAGQVDMMLISSCPPDLSNPIYHFPDGDWLTFDDIEPVGTLVKGTGRRLFGDMLNQQTAWLGVPLVNTVGTGHLRTGVPHGRLSLTTFMPFAPWLARYLPRANRMEVSCDFVPGCKVVGADGQVLTELPQAAGECFTIAPVTLPDQKPAPWTPQPPSLLPGLVYFSADIFLPWLSLTTYRRGLRRAWGRHMAPLAKSTRRGLTLAGITLALMGVVGLMRLMNSKGRKKRMFARRDDGRQDRRPGTADRDF